MITTAQKRRVIGDDAGIADGYPRNEICYLVPSLPAPQVLVLSTTGVGAQAPNYIYTASD